VTTFICILYLLFCTGSILWYRKYYLGIVNKYYRRPGYSVIDSSLHYQDINLRKDYNYMIALLIPIINILYLGFKVYQLLNDDHTKQIVEYIEENNYRNYLGLKKYDHKNYISISIDFARIECEMDNKNTFYTWIIHKKDIGCTQYIREATLEAEIKLERLRMILDIAVEKAEFIHDFISESIN